jgi:hypothetical protein
VIAGVLRLEGRPLGGQDVLAFDPEGPVLLAAGATDDAGAFTLDAPGGAVVLGKVRTDDAVAIAAALAPASGEGVELEPPPPFHRLTVRLAGAVVPERLMAFLDPVRLADVPDALTPFARQVRAGVFDGHYAQRQLPAAGLELRVQAGTWRIGAHFSVPDRDPGPAALVAGAASVGGGELPGGPYAGFELELAADVEVMLVLREEQL